MSKYAFVLFAAQSGDFIERLRELGLVDITTRGWEPSESDRQLMAEIDGSTKAVEAVKLWKATHADMQGEGYPSGKEAYGAWVAAQRDSAALATELARLQKTADELRPWGAFDVESLTKLSESGISLRYFSTQAATFDKMAAEWGEKATLAEISRSDSTVWFVVVNAAAELEMDAQELKAPAADYRAVEAEMTAAEQRMADLDNIFARVAASETLLTDYAASLREKVQTLKIEATAETAADGKLLVMEGWAEKATSDRVDALLAEYPNVVSIKSDPTEEDDTPVKLQNGWYARIFEMIGDMYARPKYGTLDLTPLFAPFYMLFFGICLNDAGYGLVLLVMGLAMLMKFREEGMMRRAAWFATLCASATIVCGTVCGSFFGLSLNEWFPSVQFFDFQGKFFSVALAIGLVQILFGMAVNIYVKARTFGILSTFGALGWFLILGSVAVAMGLPIMAADLLGMENYTVPYFTTSSPAFYAVVGLGAVLMLLLSDVKRNPLINVASGVWDLYNAITGILSDVLSYIRLFAIGLSGGVLAVVFNSLAAGFVPEGAGIVTRILIMLPILLIGHGINLFMSTISSFVHPMRLTFVEFYKNAGFEMASRAFDPLKKENQSK